MTTQPRLSFDPIAETRRQWDAHGWTDAAPGMAVVTSVMRVQQLLLARADAILEEWDLTYSRYEVLMTLLFSRVGSLPPGKIGARLQVQPGAVTNAMNLLEAQGLVRRKAHPTDGRARLATITAKGRRVALAATEELNAHLFGDLRLSETDSATLFGLLRQLRLDDFENESEEAAAFTGASALSKAASVSRKQGRGVRRASAVARAET